MKKFLSKFDIFSAPPTLRAEGEAEVVNLCGSIFSILLFTGFIFIFATSVSSLVKYQQISATQILTMDRPSDQPIGNITVSLGIFNASILQLRSIFQLHAYTTDRTLIPKPIDVFPCQRQMWSMLDDVKYHTLNIQHNLCIQRDGIEIFGEFGAPQASFIVLNLTICNNATSPVTCAPPAMINGFFATRMLWNRFIPISVVLLDTGISATKKDPLTYIAYQKTLFLLVNLKQQTFVQTFIGTYQIHTDVSFLPVDQQQLMTGYYVNQCIVTTIVNYLNLPIFIQFYIFPSPNNRVITRSYGKLDGVLSYFGGLYGIVTSFFAFFMLSFNQYKYQLRVGQGAFSYKDAHLAKSGDLNFLRYLKYVIFDWIKTLFCVSVNWKDCKAIDQARQQAIQQIDVRHLLKRISHLEKVISVFVTKQNEKVMYMAQSNSLQQVKSRRNVVQYCHKFSVADNCPTISTFQNLQTVMNYSVGPLIRTQSSLIVPDQSSSKNEKQIIFLNEEPKIKDNAQIFINRNEDKNSLDLMNEYVQKYAQKFNINENTFEVTEEQLQTQKDLAQAFYGIDQATRLSLIRKIPLGILYRMWRHNKQKPENNETIVQLSLVIQGGETRQLRRRKKRKQVGSDVSNMDKTLQLRQ